MAESQIKEIEANLTKLTVDLESAQTPVDRNVGRADDVRTARAVRIVAGVSQVALANLYEGMPAQIACDANAKRSFRNAILPARVVVIQPAIATGQMTPGAKLLNPNCVRQRGSVLVYMELVHPEHEAIILDGAGCIVQTYRTDLPGLGGHSVAATGVVKAAGVRIKVWGSIISGIGLAGGGGHSARASERLGFRLARHVVEDGIDEAAFLAFGIEAAGDVDEFIDHDLHGRFAFEEFGARGAEKRAQGGVDAGDGPLGHQCAVGHLVDFRLPVHGLFDKLAEEVDIAIGHLDALLEFLSEAEIEEFADNRFVGLTGMFHLEQCLHGVEPRGGAHLALLVAG
jgi:hypothetical protein